MTVQSFFTALFSRDASGRSWLPALLGATPRGRRAFGDLVDEPGSLVMPLSVRGASGALACFDYPAAPPRDLLRWFVDHPDELVWPDRAELSAETIRLRRALLYDDPPGSQSRAQERAREQIGASKTLSSQWWRFEDTTRLDCVLMTDRVVITVEGKRTEPLPPATPWYPKRSVLVRNLEAARHLAGVRRWGSLLLSDQPLPEATDEHLRSVLPPAAPHLTEQEREDLHSAYLGNLAWPEACDAVGIPLPALPDAARVNR